MPYYTDGTKKAAYLKYIIAGFSKMDYEVTRTIAAEEVVVTQWVFTGTHTGPLEPTVFGRRVEPTGRTIQFRRAASARLARGN